MHFSISADMEARIRKEGMWPKGQCGVRKHSLTLRHLPVFSRAVTCFSASISLSTNSTWEVSRALCELMDVHIPPTVGKHQEIREKVQQDWETSTVQCNASQPNTMRKATHLDMQSQGNIECTSVNQAIRFYSSFDSQRKRCWLWASLWSRCNAKKAHGLLETAKTACSEHLNCQIIFFILKYSRGAQHGVR